jgi:hypothetical protein
MALPWWQRPRTNKNMRVNKHTTFLRADGKTISIDKNSFIAPVRKKYLPDGHYFEGQCDETRYILADTHKGFGMLDLADVDI